MPLLDPMAIVLSTLTGLTTCLGAVPVLFIKRMSHRLMDSLMGLAAGIMLFVTTFDLLPAALGEEGANILQTLVGLALGALLLFYVERRLPHVHALLGFDKPLTKSLRTSIMIAIAITIHNLPEGFATGSAYSQGVTAFGNVVAMGIALQNIPEGLIVAAPLRGQGYTKKASFTAGVLSGLVEPVCALTALILVGLIDPLLPYALAFSGGAMLYVIFDEMTPESHSHGFEKEATTGFIAGFLFMILLNYIVLTLLA